MKNRTITIIFFLIIALAVAWKLYLVYGGLRNFSYIVPPGEDPMYHAYMVMDILSGHSETTYPLLFHWIIALISSVGDISPITVMNYITPAMILLPSIACYIFLRLNISKTAALIGFLLMLLTSNYGLVAYGDGNYPNILAMGFFAPIAFAFLVKLINDRSLKNVFGAVFFFVSTLLTHHLTTALVLAILLFFSIAVLVYSTFIKRSLHVRKISLIILGVLLAMSLSIIFLPQKAVYQNAIHNLRERGSLMATKSFVQILPITEMADITGEMIFYVGLFCFVYLVMMLGRKKADTNKLALVLILTWFVVIFALSRFEAVSLPARIAREVGIPLVLAIAVTIDDILQKASGLKHKILIIIALCLVFSGSLVQYNSGAYRRPEYFTPMVWFWPEDKEKVDYISKNLDGKIICNEATPYLKLFGEGNIIPLRDASSEAYIAERVKKINPSYLMVMNPARPVVYPERQAQDNRVEEFILSFVRQNGLQLVKEFEDGTKIYKTQSNF